jgi:Bacterial protein of unknown function (Gcw_chp)
MPLPRLVRVLGACALGTVLVVGPRPANAQATIGADVGVFNAYIWRGSSLTNKPVAQPDAYLSLPAGGGSLVLTGWGNVDLGKYSGSSDFSEGGGVASPDLTEVDLTAEYDHTLGKAVGFGVGGILYLFPNSAGFTNDLARTEEVYAKLQLTSVPLSPKLQGFYDVDKVNGAYFEGSVSYGVSAIKGFPLTFGALAGLCAGQNVGGTDNANFADNGLTHVDLSATGTLALGPVSLSPTVHVFLLHDDFTKFTEPGVQKDAKVLFGATLSWSKAVGATTRAE